MTTLIWEKKIIGGVVGGKIQASAITLHPSDMPEFGECLAVCRDLESKQIPITPEVLAMRLSESNGFYSATDFELMAKAVGSASVVFEAVDKVKAAALKTFLTERLAAIVSDEEKTGAQILDAVKQTIETADKHYRTSENNFVFLKDIVPRLEAVYRDLHNGVAYAVSTGFPRIDHELNDGFSKGDLHVVAGFTGQGKSALGLQFARYQAEKDMVVGAVSREMSDIENGQRVQSSMQGIPRWHIRHNMFDRTYEELIRGLPALAKLPIAFDTRTNDIENLRVQARRMVEQYQMKILYVDYIQLMKSERNLQRAEEVALVSRGLKLIAMENGIPVVSLCQFNRSGINASPYELLSHLKESSGIEQDASTVLYIQIEKTEERKEIKEAVATVLKNRNGATFNRIDLKYHGETFTFSE